MKRRYIWRSGVFLWVFALCFMAVSNSAWAACSVQKHPHNIKIAVFSDPHYYTSEYGTTGSAFQNYLAKDRKMLVESDAILKNTIDTIKKSDAQIVLVPGDLTKDGELLCHQRFASYLGILTKAGKKVFVIDGNHDIYNPNANWYHGDSQTRVPNISPDDFKHLYHNFGYDQAIAVDPHSLSYVVEPVKGLRIIAMDSCIYASNSTVLVTAGEFPAARLQWIKDQIKDATSQGKTILGMMHHGISAHFSVQPTYYPEYIVRDADKIAEEFSALGMNVVFTGHFHAQDIVRKTTSHGYLWDIETGSLVTYPAPYRFIELTPDKKKLRIMTGKVTHINYPTGGVDFQTYAKNYMAQGMKQLFIQEFTKVLMTRGLTQAQASAQATAWAAKQIAPPAPTTVGDLFTQAMIAHYQGDEQIDAQTKAIYQSLVISPDVNKHILGEFLMSIGTDSDPKDNQVTINLANGKASN